MTEITIGVGQPSVDVTVPTHVVEVTVPTYNIAVSVGGSGGGGGGGGSTDVYAQIGPPALGSTDLLWVDIDDASGGGGGGGDGTGVTDHGQLTGLNDPDHPISAIQGLTAALNGKADSSHAHTLADLPSTLATETEVINAITTHSGLTDPHPNYLLPAEVVAGANITITRPGDGTVSIASTGGGAGVTDHGALTGLNDPDHPIAAVQGLQAALDGKAASSHSHVLGDLPLELATDAEVTSAISTHSAAADPHTTYLNNARGDARYAATGHLHTGVYWGLWSGTQTAYNAIGTKDPNTLYCITGP